MSLKRIEGAREIYGTHYRYPMSTRLQRLILDCCSWMLLIGGVAVSVMWIAGQGY